MFRGHGMLVFIPEKHYTSQYTYETQALTFCQKHPQRDLNWGSNSDYLLATPFTDRPELKGWSVRRSGQTEAVQCEVCMVASDMFGLLCQGSSV